MTSSICLTGHVSSSSGVHGSAQPFFARRKCTCWLWIRSLSRQCIPHSADEAFGREKNYGLRKHLVDFLLHPVAETVDGNEIRFLISGQPDIMDVTVKELFNFPAGVDVVHIGIQNDLEHHPGVVRLRPHSLYSFLKLSRFKPSTRASTMRTGSFSAISSSIL